MLKELQKQIIWVLYNIFILPLLSVFLFIFRLFNKKVKERESFEYFSLDYKKKLEEFKINNQIENPKIIWFHSASMGEFEQAKPIIELLKTNNISEHFVLVTFFSPSGYNNQLNYKYADYITYLPFDTINNVKKFISFYNPELAVFVRYDLWFNFLYYLNKSKINSILISATISSKFKENSSSPFNSIKMLFYKTLLNNINTIFTANPKEYSNFNSLNITSEIINSGDTRIDRIINIVNNSKLEPIFDKGIFKNKKVIIFGSSWDEELDLLQGLITNYPEVLEKYQIIIAPHEVDESNITKIKSKIQNIKFLKTLDKSNHQKDNTINCLLYSDFENDIIRYDNTKNQIILVDSIGKLLKLYGIADIAFIGGGFKTGLHSVLEPAGFGLPIICGPKLDKQVDSFVLKENGGLFIINDNNNYNEFNSILQHLENSINYSNSSESNTKYILQNEGYSKQIYNFIINFKK